MKKVTMKELREIAKKVGIRGYSRMTRLELEVSLGFEEKTDEVIRKLKEEALNKRKRYITREQKERWETNALMKKYGDEEKALALRIYEEAIEYGKDEVIEGANQAEEQVRTYLWRLYNELCKKKKYRRLVK